MFNDAVGVSHLFGVNSSFNATAVEKPFSAPITTANNTETAKPTVFASSGKWLVQADPTFNSKFNSTWTGGAVELYKRADGGQRSAVIYGYPDNLLGEYVWIGTDHVYGQEGSTLIALSHRPTNKNATWDVDLYQIIDTVPWVALSRAKVLTGMTKASLDSMTLMTGQFIWQDAGKAKQLQLCTYTERFDQGINACIPCTTIEDLNYGIFGTFMPQQSVCQSCNTMVKLYNNDYIAIQNAHRLCLDPFGEKTTAEWDSIITNLQAVTAQPQPKPWYEKTNAGFMRGVSWFIDKIANPYLERTAALRPSWIKWLCHVALVVGLCTIPLIAVLLCCLCCRKKESKSSEESVENKEKYDDLNNFDSANDRLPNQMYDEEIRPVSHEQVQMEFPEEPIQPELHQRSYHEVQQVPGSERASEHSYADEYASEQHIEVAEA